jgi:ATP-binding cassette subfamily C protein
VSGQKTLPTVSVLMAVFNAERDIEASVRSILNQTFTDFEFIIVDDGSTDKTPEILSALACADPRLQIIRQDNTGLTRALNRGLQSVRGRYIARQDADDLSSPDRLYMQVAEMEKDPRIVLCGSACETLYPGGATSLWKAHDPDTLQKVVFLKTPFAHSTAMMRADTCRTLGGYDPSFQTSQDAEFWIRFAKAGRLVMLAAPLVQRKVSGSSISATRRIRQCLDALRARWIHSPALRRPAVVYHALRTLLIGFLPHWLLHTSHPRKLAEQDRMERASLRTSFSFFFNAYRIDTLTVIGLLILAGLAEAVGVAAFLPFFQIVLEEKDHTAPLPEGRMSTILAATGIPLTFPTIAAFIALAMGAKAAILWLALRKVSHAVARISADLRWRLMQALLQANWRFFTGHALGSSLNAVVMETFRASMAFVSATRFFSYVIQFLVYATGALLLSPEVFIGGILFGFLLVAALWTLVRMARSAGHRQTSIAKAMLTDMADMLQGIKPLRAMALEKKFLDLLRSHSTGLEKAQVDQLVSAQSMRIFHEPLMVFTAIGGLYLATTYADLSGSTLILMTILFIRLLTGMNNAQGEYQRLATQESALWSLTDIIHETEAAADNWPGHAAPPETVETVLFENVGFSHAGKSVLSDANLTIRTRRMTALVGVSGSGKTTILDLLSGFYTPQTGAIRVNGRTLSEIDLHRWRRLLGFVPQEVFLFNDTVLENILMGRNFLCEDDARRALEAAGAWDFVQALPQGLHAPVGENGRRLSGGQRQRIAIARAIVHNPQILLLDEATSALDPQMERVLLETLKSLSRRMTVLLVSHNTAVLDYADTVYKVYEGRVEEFVQ